MATALTVLGGDAGGEDTAFIRPPDSLMPLTLSNDLNIKSPKIATEITATIVTMRFAWRRRLADWSSG